MPPESPCPEPVERGEFVLATYREIALRFGLSSPNAARTKARRAGWIPEPANHPADALRIQVPRAVWDQADETPHPTSLERAPARSQEGASQRPDTAFVRVLEEHISTLREQLAEAERRIAREAARADRAEARAEQTEAALRKEHEAARRLSEQLAALSVDLARLAAAPAPPVRDLIAHGAELVWVARQWRRWIADWLRRL